MCKTRTALVISSVLLVYGCSANSGVSSPVKPAETQATTIQSATFGRTIFGIYNFTLGPDRQFSLTEVRSAENHFDVTKPVSPPTCSDCLLIELVSQVGETWQFKITLKNPSKITGYDTRITVVKQVDITILNPSSYTKVFALPDDPNPINPFVIFDSSVGQNQWSPGAQASTVVTLQKPAGSKFSQIQMVVDACYPLNEEEPYELTNMAANPAILDDGGTISSNISVDVFDWQSNVDKVTIDLSPLGGSSTAAMTKTSGNTWTINDVHYVSGGQGPGTCRLLITGSSAANETCNYAYVAIEGKSTGWARTWGNVGLNSGHAVATDGLGNVYVSGGFRGTADFDPGNGTDNHTTNGTDDAYVTKYDSSGNFLWARTWGGTDHDWGDGVAVDGSGNVYVTGEFVNTVDFDPGSGTDVINSNGSWDVYLSKFDSFGNFIWARTWGGSGDDYGNGVALDSSGSAYITGYFSGKVDFDPGVGKNVHNSNGTIDAFVTKLDSSGNFVRAQTWGGTGYDSGYQVAVDDSGNTYVTGEFQNTVDFDPGSATDTHASAGSCDAYLSRFDSSGNFLWARTWGGLDDDYGFGIAIDLSHNAYVAGDFKDTFDFNPGPGTDNHASNGNWDAYLSKFDTSGNFIWARTWGGADEDEARGPALTGSGDIYVPGQFFNTVDFDPGPGIDNHTSNGLPDAFLSKFDSSGNLIWARTWGGESGDGANAVAADSLENAYVAGDFSYIADFDPGPGVDNHTCKGLDDVFLSKFPSDGNW